MARKNRIGRGSTSCRRCKGRGYVTEWSGGALRGIGRRMPCRCTRQG